MNKSKVTSGEANKLADGYQMVINGVTITRPLEEYKPEELGISSFATIAYNCLKDDTPEVSKLAIANDSGLTKYIMYQKLAPDYNISSVAIDFANDVMLNIIALAESSDDKSTAKTVSDMMDSLEKFISDDDVDSLKNIDKQCKIISENRDYKQFVNVLLTALHTGYNF